MDNLRGIVLCDMATLQQEAAVDKLIEQGGRSMSKAMRTSKVPYSPESAKNPQKLTRSKGYREILQRRGLTEDFITERLIDDIEAKPQKRFLELNLGAEILGMKKKSEQAVARVLIVNITDRAATKYGINESTGGSGQ